jgi:hypothetical protein
VCLRGGRHVRSYLERQEDLPISVSVVWLPMLPRLAERRALPGAVRELAGAGFAQYWDDARAIGHELKERVIPGYDGEIAWDVWVLFDEEATWDSAQGHVVAWGATVAATEEELFARLDRIGDRERP